MRPTVSATRTGRLLAATLSSLLLLTACSSGEDGTSGTGSNTPVQGGTLTAAVDTEPVSWDIHASTQDVTAEIQRQVFDSLVSQDAQGKFHPWLATKWEVAADYKSYTFHLRDDVTFSDGTKLDASAVKANFDHIVAKSTKSLYAASLLGPYTGTQVVDAHTAKVTFSKPFAPFLQAAGTTYLGLYSPKALAANAGKLAAGGPADVGSGPFVFSSYTKGQSAVLTRNPKYDWGPATAKHTGPAYLDKLVIRFLPTASVRAGALTSGQVQVAKAIPPQNVTTVKATPGLSLISRQAPGGNYNLWLNGSIAPLDDQRVRQAIQRGIDIGQDVKTVTFGQYPRAWSPISPTTPDYDKSLEGSWPYDPKLSAKLLDEAGWTGRDAQGYRTKNGKRLTVNWPLLSIQATREGRDVLAQAIQADLKKIGVEVKHPSLDLGTYNTEVYGGKANFVDLSWPRFSPDVLWLFLNSGSAPAKGGINATFVKDADLDKWTDEGRATLDEKVHADVYTKVQQRAVDLALVVPLYTQVSLVGESAKVKGLTFNASNWLTYYDVWLDSK
ncbi:ABC transporter substrate-binding protein [Streptomyces sp. MBT53]|uniref:ABC transporter substrate-binding protein n=1 Tax=Streptomyces sp. MBT53 TaxID=1488384 RepID=UPI00191310A7|nr:ABC transporter substrate-binding protein [Streptomyces sp. MBT53]MBK6016059.1 ABC transporter substrate-binding protein [Streptomyces sp. MBT53]